MHDNYMIMHSRLMHMHMINCKRPRSHWSRTTGYHQHACEQRTAAIAQSKSRNITGMAYNCNLLHVCVHALNFMSSSIYYARACLISGYNIYIYIYYIYYIYIIVIKSRPIDIAISSLSRAGRARTHMQIKNVAIYIEFQWLTPNFIRVLVRARPRPKHSSLRFTAACGFCACACAWPLTAKKSRPVDLISLSIPTTPSLHRGLRLPH